MDSVQPLSHNWGKIYPDHAKSSSSTVESVSSKSNINLISNHRDSDKSIGPEPNPGLPGYQFYIDYFVSDIQPGHVINEKA